MECFVVVALYNLLILSSPPEWRHWRRAILRWGTCFKSIENVELLVDFFTLKFSILL